MSKLLKDFGPLLAVIVPLASAIVAWWLNEMGKRRWETYKRKEQRYVSLLKSLRGFYVRSQDATEKERFLEELRLAWLYCPDKVIKAGNAFLATVATGAKCSDQEKESALAGFVIALRKDLNPSTKLTVDDHRNWRST